MMKINDDLLRQAIAQEIDREIADLTTEKVTAPRALQHAQAIPTRGKWLRFAGKRVAIFAVVILVMLTSAISVKAVREPAVAFFTETVGGWIHTVYDAAIRARAPQIIERAYAPQYIPAGYQLLRQGQHKLSAHYIWENEKGELLMFDQSTLHGESYVRSQGATLIEWNGVQVLYYKGNSYHVYYWNTNEYEFCLSAHARLSDEEIVKIASSLAEAPMPGGES
ncbi:MAG: DUF4367 domain-containing protein [Clostridia bacterium]|nr:DUF4367 domain-containing protein [Clostridia bacterium]